jgi:sulfur relay (sulfurtransferase) complex TusBCD TusD component (DsrE family)
MKLGILLTTSLESEDVRTTIALAKAALQQGHEVKIYVMCDGVFNLFNDDFLALMKEGVSIGGASPAKAQLLVCAQNSNERKIEKDPFADVSLWASQYDNAQLFGEVDRLLTFN